MRKMQQAANNSPQVRQLKARQEAIDNSPRVKQVCAGLNVDSSAYDELQQIENPRGAIMHSPPAQRRTMRGDQVIQRALLEDLEGQKTKIAIGGEKHSQGNFNKEQQVWGNFGIAVKTELSSLEYDGENGNKAQVTPDDPLFRVWFGFVAFKDTLVSVENSASQLNPNIDLQKLMLENKEDPNIPLYEKIKKDLQKMKQAMTTALGSAKRSTLITNNDNLKLIIPALEALIAKLDTAYNNVTGRNPDHPKIHNIKTIGDQFVAKWKKDLSDSVSGQSNLNEKDMLADDSDTACLLRSQRMLTNLITASSGLNKHVYKMGDQHVKDIKGKNLPVPNSIAVYEESPYGNELDYAEKEIPKRKFAQKYGSKIRRRDAVSTEEYLANYGQEDKTKKTTDENIDADVEVGAPSKKSALNTDDASDPFNFDD